MMPFINFVLGYDVFNSSGVTPEHICDIGTKEGEKIDYAILKDSRAQILIECRKIGEPLHINYVSQPFRYFHVTGARISILASGQVYKFFTGPDAPNKVDEKPFLELDLLNVDEYVLPEFQKLTKAVSDVDSIASATRELRHVSQTKREMTNQFDQPDDDFVRFFAARVYDGIITQKVRGQSDVLTREAASQFLGDRVNDRLRSATGGAI